MNVSLVVHRVGPDTANNVAQMDLAVTQSAKAGAHIVLFSEAATTGLILNDDPRHDLMLGEPIPGPAVSHFSELARSSHIYVAFGILERDGAALYDAAVLLGPTGDLLLKYRRIDPGWHSQTGESRLYREGTQCPGVDTPVGRFAFAICGDLFNDTVAEQVRLQHPDYLLMPFSRCFDSGLYDQQRWESEERRMYINRVQDMGVTTFMTNSLGEKAFDGGTFGGAMVVHAGGRITHSLHLGMPGMIVAAV
ncbi:MAG TPA: carbon-nitrogen hydrolase family protein [Candidatus Cryosericum sp.]|nr:carbon-nitrogen hydrolase family protein [Candidatus Cryosericum sp.]